MKQIIYDIKGVFLGLRIFFPNKMLKNQPFTRINDFILQHCPCNFMFEQNFWYMISPDHHMALIQGVQFVGNFLAILHPISQYLSQYDPISTLIAPYPLILSCFVQFRCIVRINRHSFVWIQCNQQFGRKHLSKTRNDSIFYKITV